MTGPSTTIARLRENLGRSAKWCQAKDSSATIWLHAVEAADTLKALVRQVADMDAALRPVGYYEIDGDYWHIATTKERLAALQAKVEAMEGALRPFSDACDDLADDHRDNSPIWESYAAMGIDAGHLRAARAALSQTSGGADG